MTSPSPPVVCIVEDDKPVRDSLVALMRCSGYQPVSYTSAEDLLDQQNSPEADFLIVDVRLPGMSGIELLDQLATNGQAKPAVIVTGHADFEEVEESLRRKDVQFLTKPCEPNTLLQLIATALA